MVHLSDVALRYTNFSSIRARTSQEETASLSPEERGRALEKSTAFTDAHHAFEVKGQSAVPTPDKADVDTHYVTFVFDEKSKNIVELDGRKGVPVHYKYSLCEKAAESDKQHFLKGVAAVIRDEFVAKSQGDLRFQLIAVGDARAGRIQQQ